MSSKWHKVIGIDLGTTYSAVAAYNIFAEQAEIISDPESDNPATTASVISLDPKRGKVLVGSAAKRNVAVNPSQTVIEIKREMGAMFRPDTLVKFGAQDRFSTQDPLQVQFAQGELMLPQEISAFTLMRMKEIAEREIGEEIRDAVITVPAYFSESQKKATEEAALLAGLYPRQLIPEPTAAAVCYGADMQESARKVYLVFDLGGGTFDVSIIQVEGSHLEVIATSGDPRLGGGDFDDAITSWAVEKLLHEGLDVRHDRVSQARIKVQAEIAKIALSRGTRAVLDLAFLRNPSISILVLSRSTFLELIDGILKKSLDYVDAAVASAASKGVERDRIDAILLVGGSSKIPRVKEMLLEHFQKDETFVRGDLNPDTVVARGAAIIANRFSPTPGRFDITRKKEALLINTEALDLQDVRLIAEHSLGIVVQDNRCFRIVERGTTLPIDTRLNFVSNLGPAEYADISVYEGESDNQYDNALVGTLKIGPMSKHEADSRLEVDFKLDVSGLLTMIVNHVNERTSYEATFDQKATVGSDDALAKIRNKLLGLYAPLGATDPANFAETPAVQIQQPIWVPPASYCAHALPYPQTPEPACPSAPQSAPQAAWQSPAAPPSPNPHGDPAIDLQLEHNLAEMRDRIANLERLPRGSQTTPRIETVDTGAPVQDDIACTVFAAKALVPAQPALIQVYAHLTDKGDEAASLAVEMDERATRLGFRSLDVEVARGTKLTFNLVVPGLEVDDPVQSLIWRGRTEAVAFAVTAPRVQSAGVVIGQVTVAQDSVPIGHIKFRLCIQSDPQPGATQETAPVGHYSHRYTMAFISYASQDRDKVLARVQMLKPLGVRYFQDVLDLEPGDRWEKQLYQHIDESDLFLLFWSSAAHDSEWVLREVRYALTKKAGNDDAPPEIYPIIIEGPPVVPPPPELAHLHFNDRIIYFMADGA